MKKKYTVEMQGDNLLLQPVETEPQSEFVTEPQKGAIFVVCYAGPEAGYKARELVILSQGPYEELAINGETYTMADKADVVGRVKEGK